MPHSPLQLHQRVPFPPLSSLILTPPGMQHTGASAAHMTFNRHWMRNLKPHRVQIRLADGSVVYSEGVGSVRFNPVINGQEMAPLEFTNVLYVPALCTNLFSVLYLTLHRRFTVSIERDTMHFIPGTARVATSRRKVELQSNAAYLVGISNSCGGVRFIFICYNSPLGLGPLASSPLPFSLG